MRKGRVSCMEGCDDVGGASVVLRAREEVREDVLLSRTVPRIDGDVVLQRQPVDLAEQAGESGTPRCLLVQHVYVRLVVNEE